MLPGPEGARVLVIRGRHASIRAFITPYWTTCGVRLFGAPGFSQAKLETCKFVRSSEYDGHPTACE
jgi:hypothetical protein